MTTAWTPEFLRLTAALFRQLPAERRWTKGRRDRWLRAMAAAVDLHFDVETVIPSQKVAQREGGVGE